MDEVCTMAFDGECEVYKRFGLTRVVSYRYVDGSGSGSSVEVNVSRFRDDAGAYAMYTLRVVAGDPAEAGTPKPLEAGAAGAMGTGRAYVWRGTHLVELQYVNEQQSPEALSQSSAKILEAVGKAVGAQLPGVAQLPAAARALPGQHLLPNGIVFHPKDALGWTGIGPAAVGFYRDEARRWRALSVARDSVQDAKKSWATLTSRPGTQPMPAAGLGVDEAAMVSMPVQPGQPALKMMIARKGAMIFGVGDEEYALREAAQRGADIESLRVGRDRFIDALRAWSAQSVLPESADAGAPTPKATPAPSRAH